MAGELGSVGYQPGLHARDHQLCLIVPRDFGTLPPILRIKVPPCAGWVVRLIGARNRALTVDQEDRVVSRAAESSLEAVERSIARAACDHLRQTASESRTGEQVVEAPSALALEFCPVPAAFHVQQHAHQRLPPIWPLVQSSPRWYFSNQTLRSSRLRRSIYVAPS